jgi:hypothetical protein
MTEHEWDELKGRELDDGLVALFKAADAPAPRSGFTSRTMRAVRREPPPTGRRALRHPLVAPFGLAASIAVSIGAAYFVLATQPGVAELFARLLAAGVRVGMWPLTFVGQAATFFGLFSATGLAVARAVATRDGSIGLTLTAAVAALSLAALRRLLISESEVPPWQELS